MLQKSTVSPTTFQLLNAISTIPELDDFYLAGGTALALQIGHRTSYDLDFFGEREFTTDEILDLLRPVGRLSIISQQKNILILNVNDIKVDFVNYSYPLIDTPIIERPIRLLSMTDIAAMKLSAIAGRGRKRDFYDLYFLLKRFSLKEMMSFYNQKYKDGSEMMVARSLTFFDDADPDEGPRVLDQDISWASIKNTILDKVRELY